MPRQPETLLVGEPTRLPRACSSATLLAVSAGEVVTKTSAFVAGADAAALATGLAVLAVVAVPLGADAPDAAGAARSRSVHGGKAACDSTRASIACDCAVPFSLTSIAARTVSPKLSRRTFACSSIGACAVVPSCQRASPFCRLIPPIRKPVLSSWPRVDIAGQRPSTCALAVSAPLGAAAAVAVLPGSANSRQSGASRASAGALIAASHASPAPSRSRPTRPSNLTRVAVGAEGGVGERGRRAVVAPGAPGPAAARRRARFRRRRCRRCRAARRAPAATAAPPIVAGTRTSNRLPAFSAVRALAPGRAVRTRPPRGRVELIEVQAALQMPRRLGAVARRRAIDRSDGAGRTRLGTPDLDPLRSHAAVELQLDGARRAAVGEAPLQRGDDVDRRCARAAGRDR